MKKKRAGGSQRERDRDGKADVAVVTGTLHCSDFNRSSDTHTLTHSEEKK